MPALSVTLSLQKMFFELSVSILHFSSVMYNRLGISLNTNNFASYLTLV